MTKSQIIDFFFIPDDLKEINNICYCLKYFMKTIQQPHQEVTNVVVVNVVRVLLGKTDWADFWGKITFRDDKEFINGKFVKSEEPWKVVENSLEKLNPNK